MYLLLKNIVTSPAMMPNGEPWRGAREKSNILFQLLIDACSKFGDIVVDLTTSTGASLQACRASSRHFIGAKRDVKLYHAVLALLLPGGPLPSRGEGQHSRSDASKSMIVAERAMVESFMSSGAEGLPAQIHLQNLKRKAESGKAASDSLKRKKKHRVSVRRGEDDEAESQSPQASRSSRCCTKQS